MGRLSQNIETLGSPGDFPDRDFESSIFNDFILRLLAFSSSLLHLSQRKTALTLNVLVDMWVEPSFCYWAQHRSYDHFFSLTDEFFSSFSHALLRQLNIQCENQHTSASFNLLRWQTVGCLRQLLGSIVLRFNCFSLGEIIRLKARISADHFLSQRTIRDSS